MNSKTDFNVLGAFKGSPMPFQKEDATIILQGLRSSKGFLIGYETGLGKTFTSLYVLSQLKSCRNILITGGKSAMATWQTEIQRWTEASRHLRYIGVSVPNYLLIWEDFVKGVPGIYLVNRTLLLLLNKKQPKKTKITCDAVIVDEAHKLRNRKTQLFRFFTQLRYRHILLLTATPSSRGPQDLWTYLHLMDPKLFSSYWRFVETFCYVEEGMFGLEVFGARNIKALKRLLTRFYVKRTYKEVVPYLPPTRRQIMEVEMDPDQTVLYNKMSKDMMLELPGGQILPSPGTLALITRLRQLALCPKLLHPDFPVGACVSAVLEEILEGEGENPMHTVVFSLYRELLVVISQILAEKKISWEILHGGLEPAEVQERVTRFKKNRSVMLCVITFAESFALDTVSTAYVIGPDFDPTVNIQAEGRLRRVDSNLTPAGVLVRYVLPKGTREEVTKQILDNKTITVSQYLGGV